MIPDPAPPYELDMSGILKQRIRRMVERADQLGAGPAIRRSIAKMFNRLINRPREWGDPVQNRPHAQLVEYHGRYGEFVAIYAVHDRIPMVFFNHLIPLPRNPLFGENFAD